MTGTTTTKHRHVTVKGTFEKGVRKKGKKIEVCNFDPSCVWQVEWKKFSDPFFPSKTKSAARLFLE